MLIFQIKRIISSEKWLNGEKKEDGQTRICSIAISNRIIAFFFFLLKRVIKLRVLSETGYVFLGHFCPKQGLLDCVK